METKTTISKTLKIAVWNEYMGIDERKGMCFGGCGNEIRIENFSCGHVISSEKGGPATLDNLRPVCGMCNSSMGTKNMSEFVKSQGLHANVQQKCNKTKSEALEQRIKKIDKNLHIDTRYEIHSLFGLMGHQKETYTSGYTLKSVKIIRKIDFIVLCDLLKSEFNELYETSEYNFEPEDIVCGGIVFSNFKHYPEYKTMYIDISKLGTYGRVDENVVEEWKNNNDILCNKGKKMETFLKALHGAPIWKIKELKMFDKCFNIIGLRVCSEYPAEESLTSYANKK